MANIKSKSAKRIAIFEIISTRNLNKSQDKFFFFEHRVSNKFKLHVRTELRSFCKNHVLITKISRRKVTNGELHESHISCISTRNPWSSLDFSIGGWPSVQLKIIFAAFCFNLVAPPSAGNYFSRSNTFH